VLQAEAAIVTRAAQELKAVSKPANTASR
jgi:hypothetical protein